MNDALLALYELQKVDTELDKVQKVYSLLDRGADEKTVLDAAKAKSDLLESTLHSLSGDLQASELELSTIQTKSKDYETRLYNGSTTNFKELQAMEQEVEALKRQSFKLEEKIVQLKQSLETSKAEDEAVKAEVKAATKSYNAKQRAFKATEKVLRAEAQILVDKQGKLSKGVDAVLMARYKSLRKNSKQGFAVAILEGNSCSACRTSLPSNLVTAVIKTTLAQTCDNCGRFLCYIG